MNLIEFIGFIVSMIALFFLMFKQAREAKRRKENPETYSEEQIEGDAALQELLQSLNIHTPIKPIRPRIVHETSPTLEEYEESSPIEPAPVVSPSPKKHFFDPYKDPYAIEKRKPVKHDLFKKVSLKEAIILSVILGPPKGQ